MESGDTRQLLKQSKSALKERQWDEARAAFDLAVASIQKAGTLTIADDVALAIVLDLLMEHEEAAQQLNDYFSVLRKQVFLLADVQVVEGKSDHTIKAYLKCMDKLGVLGQGCEQIKKLVERRRKERGRNDASSQVIADTMERVLECCWLAGEELDDINPATVARIESRHRRRCYEEIEKAVAEFEQLSLEDGDALLACLLTIDKQLRADPHVLDEHKGLRQRLLDDISDAAEALSEPQTIVKLLASWQDRFAGERSELFSILSLALGRALSVVDRPTIMEYGELVLRHGQSAVSVERWGAWMQFCEQYLLEGSLAEAAAALVQAVDACFQAKRLPDEPGRCPWLTSDRRLRNAMLHLPVKPLCDLLSLAVDTDPPADHWIFRAVERMVDQWWHLKPRSETERLLRELLKSADITADRQEQAAQASTRVLDDLRARLVLLLLSENKAEEALALYDDFAPHYLKLSEAPQFVRRVCHKLSGRRPRPWNGTSRGAQEIKDALSQTAIEARGSKQGFGDLFAGGGIAGMTAVCMATTFRLLVSGQWITVRALREEDLPDSDLHLDSAIESRRAEAGDEWWQRWYKDLGRELLAAWPGSLPGQSRCVITIGRAAAVESTNVRWNGPGAAVDGELQKQADSGADAAVVFKQRVAAAVNTLSGKPALLFPDQHTVERVEVTAIFCCDGRTIMRYPPVVKAAAVAKD